MSPLSYAIATAAPIDLIGLGVVIGIVVNTAVAIVFDALRSRTVRDHG